MPMWRFRCLFADLLKAFTCAEYQRDAPNAGKCYDRVDDAAEQGRLTTADPCDNIELEQSDASPVEGTHDGEYKGDPIHYHKKSRFLPAAKEAAFSFRKSLPPSVKAFIRQNFSLLLVCPRHDFLCGTSDVYHLSVFSFI